MPRIPTAIKSRYQRYLASREWGEMRESVRRRSGDRCEHCCHAPQQAVHHLTYERVGNEHLGDLLAVCEPCHDFLSGRSKTNPLDAYYVVTPPIDIGPHFSHWLLREFYQRPAAAPIVRYCVGDGCIWCGYAIADWHVYMDTDWMPPD